MRYAVLLGLGVTAGVYWTWGMVGPQDDHPPEPIHSAVTKQTIEGIGFIEPASELRRLATRRSGIVAECVIPTGKPVEKGSVLLRLDDHVSKSAVIEAERWLAFSQATEREIRSGAHPQRIVVAEQALVRLQAELDYANRELDRQVLLSERQVITDEVLGATRHQKNLAELRIREQRAELAHLRQWTTPEALNVAVANVSFAEAKLDKAQCELEESYVRAPFAGTVLRYLVREGESSDPATGHAAVLFANLDHLRVRAEIDERFAKDLRIGATVVVHGFNLRPSRLSGRVAAFEAVMGPKSVFLGSSREWRDQHVVDTYIEIPGLADLPIGLQVEVTIDKE